MADPGGELGPSRVSEINGAPAAVPADAGFLPGAPLQQAAEAEGAAPPVAPRSAPASAPLRPTGHNTAPPLISTLIII